MSPLGCVFIILLGPLSSNTIFFVIFWAKNNMTFIFGHGESINREKTTLFFGKSLYYVYPGD